MLYKVIAVVTTENPRRGIRLLPPNTPPSLPWYLRVQPKKENVKRASAKVQAPKMQRRVLSKIHFAAYASTRNSSSHPHPH
jgi:hypothetical protein